MYLNLKKLKGNLPLIFSNRRQLKDTRTSAVVNLEFQLMSSTL